MFSSRILLERVAPASLSLASLANQNQAYYAPKKLAGAAAIAEAGSWKPTSIFGFNRKCGPLTAEQHAAALAAAAKKQ